MPWTCNTARAEWRARRRATDPEYVRRRLRLRASQRRLRRRLPQLIERQGGVCPLCARFLPDTVDGIHVDHRVPRAHGGGDGIDNLQAVHAACNLAKGAS